MNFVVIPYIADRVPDEHFPRKNLKIPKDIDALADPQFNVPREIDMLVGSGATLSFLSVGQIHYSQGEYDLVFQNTLFGWVVAGGLKSNRVRDSVSCNLLKSNGKSILKRKERRASFCDLGRQIEKFWQIEEVRLESDTHNDEDACERHYRENTTRDPSGRYIVRLPFKQFSPELGNSRSRARRRFNAVREKLKRDPTLEVEYAKVLDEYITLGHMTLVDDEKASGYYLPHHAVLKLSSNTTKVRVVFDASAKTDKNVSLNDHLLKGPIIQDKLFTHLLRFRGHKYVLTADIEKMYRQVLIHPDDRHYQRIFWYFNGQVAVYELTTVTFGVALAPFLAIRTIHQVADDERVDFPQAASILKRDLYVDDLLTGADTLEDALKIRDDVIELLNRGGFKIRQWASNHKHALDKLETKIFDVDSAIEQNPVSKTLGITWDSNADTFVYTVKPILLPDLITKRIIFSEIAKIFDPLGILGPVILFAKKLMQDCWRLKCGWDEPVSQEIYTRWIQFAKQLSAVRNLTIDRRLVIDGATCIELHCFCDASQNGYGACMYVRSTDANGKTLIRLACAKSRVAPLKTKTIPQLELCGALTLVQLYTELLKAFTFTIDRVFFWCDSTIALYWIKKSPSELKIFEANRVRQIQEITGGEWRYVNTQTNPADSLSRGQLPLDFLENQTWMNGPAWLLKTETNWPVNIVETPAILPGVKRNLCLVTETSVDIFSRFSSYSLLVKTIAFVLRVKDKNKNRGPITVEEKTRAERCVLKRIQLDQFSVDIRRLQNSKNCKSARLNQLNPFIDEHGLLRVGGRINKAEISPDRKFPVILPSFHHVTDLLIRDTHIRNFHAATRAVHSTLRQRFWLFNANDQIRKIVRKCTICVRWKPTQIHSQMGNLPFSRVNESAAFTHVGIDFFGPMYIKEKKFRNTKKLKSYGCVFVCMSSKAIHIEIVSDLTTEGFLGAFRRFVARRGLPTNVYSDNGTNFVGAKNELQELYALFNSEQFKSNVTAFSTQRNIQWHFTPPLSPHFGGLWEAAVKSFKHHFKRVAGNQLLTFEALNTLAVEIEGILNSRPLCALSNDPNDLLVLTPAHILIGRPMNFLPEPDLTTVPGNHLKTYRFITKARQDFAKRWKLEYLSELQKRLKWHDSNHKLGVNSVVLLMDKTQSCSEWQLGVIDEEHPGNDGILRVVTVRTNRGLFKRNVTHLCPLPVASDEEK